VRIAIGSDHRGFAHKTRLAIMLGEQGHEVLDCGCPGPEPADYPDAAFCVAEAVAQGRCARGVLICGSGIGMSIAANKVRGIRASLCVDAGAARQTVAHNDSNVLCLSGDRNTPEQAWEITQAWLGATFEGERHARRVQKIRAYEDAHNRRGPERRPGPAGPGG
jgi:RpiB/LacA/LacB family sugar-phosphate isomerase